MVVGVRTIMFLSEGVLNFKVSDDNWNVNRNSVISAVFRLLHDPTACSVLEHNGKREFLH